MTTDEKSSAYEAAEAASRPPSQRRPHFPESKEEKAERLAQTVRRIGGASSALESTQGGLPPLTTLEARIAQRLQAAGGTIPSEMVQTLAASMAQEGHTAAGRFARDEMTSADLSERSLASLEAVVRVIGRPAWFVRQDVPQTGEAVATADDQFWIVQIAAAKKALWSVCACVGCIMKQQDGTRVPIGTGWMIGDRTVVTNAHVAGHLARRRPVVPPGDKRDGWRLRPDVKGVIDFAFENGENRSSTFDIGEVLYVSTTENPDLSIFRLQVADAGPHSPGPVALDLTPDRDAGWEQTKVFAVGHPMADLNYDSNVAAVFGPLDSTKRISPGMLLRLMGEDVLTHDCSTTNGSSGSPVIDFASLKVVGLHYFGKPGDRNEAVFLPGIASHPAIINSLSGQWGL